MTARDSETDVIVFLSGPYDGPPDALLSKEAAFTSLADLFMSDWDGCKMPSANASLRAASLLGNLEAALLTTTHIGPLFDGWRQSWPTVRFMLVPDLNGASFAVLAARKRENNGDMAFATNASSEWVLSRLGIDGSHMTRVSIGAHNCPKLES